MTEQLTGVTTDRRGATETNGRWLKAGGLTATFLSVVGSLVGYGVLPARIRIHWSIAGPYYGPEFAPTWVILVLFPLFVGTAGLGSYWLGTRVRTGEGFGNVWPVFTLAAMSTIAVLIVTQAVLIVMNF